MTFEFLSLTASSQKLDEYVRSYMTPDVPLTSVLVLQSWPYSFAKHKLYRR